MLSSAVAYYTLPVYRAHVHPRPHCVDYFLEEQELIYTFSRYLEMLIPAMRQG
jgi:hypothetical protein